MSDSSSFNSVRTSELDAISISTITPVKQNKIVPQSPKQTTVAPSKPISSFHFKRATLSDVSSIQSDVDSSISVIETDPIESYSSAKPYHSDSKSESASQADQIDSSSKSSVVKKVDSTSGESQSPLTSYSEDFESLHSTKETAVKPSSTQYDSVLHKTSLEYQLSNIQLDFDTARRSYERRKAILSGRLTAQTRLKSNGKMTKDRRDNGADLHMATE